MLDSPDRILKQKASLKKIRDEQIAYALYLEFSKREALLLRFTSKTKINEALTLPKNTPSKVFSPFNKV